MRTIGNDVYIQRGEDFSLDLSITNRLGEPYMLPLAWTNPYLAITVTAARYEQKGDFRETYWLDLNRRYVEQEDGQVVQEAIKRFADTVAYPLPGQTFSLTDVISTYVNNGKMTVNDPTNLKDVKNFLFFTVNQRGERTFKYLVDYTYSDEDFTETWKPYSFRFVKVFRTKSWTEQKYLYDAKVLAGESVHEHVQRALVQAGISVDIDEPLKQQIDKMPDGADKENTLWAYEYGMPLMPDYDTKTIVLEPQNLFVSANIQGGVK